MLFIMCLCVWHGARAQERIEAGTTRPKVGLVLSGGGARGAAHVGVIRLIEEMDIPVDYVAGTSMGAIVGALFAIGYTADEMDSLFRVQDWKVLLSNDVPRTMQPYSQRLAKMRYQVNIPYENSVPTENSARYRDAGIKVRGNSLRTFPKALVRPGIIDGQNLLNVFTGLTIAYQDSMDYSQLPRPYACVAADLVTGEGVILDHGSLAESMRASMSIPGVFYPVYKGNQVLVDGGVVNNYPVNVARDMGADIIIGVEVNAGRTAPEDLHSFPAIFEQLVGTLGVELHRKNVRDTDILIRPQVKKFPVMDFDTLNLRKLMHIGYEEALRSKPRLDSLKSVLARYSDSTGRHLQVSGDNITSASHIPIQQITVVGYDEPTMLSLLAKYGIEEGRVVSVDELSEAVDRIYGMGTFSSVQYHLAGDEPYTLELYVKPNPTNQVGLGLRLDSEEAAAALLSIGIDRLKLSGPKLDFVTRLSVNPWVMARASYAWTNGLQMNASVKYWFSDVNRFYTKNSHAFNYHFYGSDVYLSNILSRSYDLRLGARYDYFLIHNLVRDELEAHSYTSAENHDSYTGMYVRLRNDLYNAAYFPTRGYSYGIELAYNMKNSARATNDFWTVQADASMVVPLSGSTAVQPALYGRFLMGNKIPFVYTNAVGGYLPMRYLRQQVPFVGLTGCEFMERNLTIFRMDIRQKLSPDIYMSGIVNYAHSETDLFDGFREEGVWGVGLQLSYDTTIGPLSICGHWNDKYNRLGAYFSIGFDF